VIRTLRDLSPDAVVLNNQFGERYIASLRGRVPLVSIVHVDFPTEAQWRSMSGIAAQADLTIAVSTKIVKALGAGGVDPDRIMLIPYGVKGTSSSRSKPSAQNVHVVFVGRLVQPHKRVLDVIPFMRAATALLPGVRLTVLGDGPERTAISEAATRFGLPVDLAGAVSADAVSAIHRTAHFLVQFSEFEGLSIALLEAMAHGVVPIATAIESGVGDLIRDGQNGFLFPVGQTQRAAELLAAALPAWSEYSEAARSTIQRGFSRERMLDRYATLFTALTPPHKPGPWTYVDQGYEGWRAGVARRMVPAIIYKKWLQRSP
jgi:glycosyltransferase involved in cell wall biosynthesis